MSARVTLKAVNDELARRGHHARLKKGSGYSTSGREDAADWIDRTVREPTLNTPTLKRWIGGVSVAEEDQCMDRKPRRTRALGLNMMSSPSISVVGPYLF